MFDYIENLRKRPEAERKKAVFKISLTITLIIAGIWGASLFISSKNNQVATNTTGKLDDMPSLKETLSTFFGQVEKIVKNKESSEILEQAAPPAPVQEILINTSSSTVSITPTTTPSVASTTGGTGTTSIKTVTRGTATSSTASTTGTTTRTSLPAR